MTRSKALCVRCKVVPATVSVRSALFCHACLEAQIATRLRTNLVAVTLTASRSCRGSEVSAESHSCTDPKTTTDSRIHSTVVSEIHPETLQKTDPMTDPVENHALVPLSGGTASLSLLNLLTTSVPSTQQSPDESLNRQFNSVTRKRRLRLRLTVAWIDESCLFSPTDLHSTSASETLDLDSTNSSQNTTERTADKIARIAQSLNLPLVSLRIQDVFAPPFSSKDNNAVLLSKDISTARIILKTVSNASPTDTPETMLRSLVDALAPSTAESLIASFKTMLINHLAETHLCSAIIYGDCADRLAIKSISAIAKGQGFHVPSLVESVSTSPSSGIRVLRPLRDTLLKELAVYAAHNKLPIIATPDLTTGKPVNASIERLTEHFIVGLQRDFVSTVSTALRTVCKIQNRVTGDEGQCVFCGGPREPMAGVWKRRCTVAINGVLENNDTDAESAPTDGLELMCYSCHNLSLDLKHDVVVPGFMVQRSKSSSDEELRTRIQDFLIDDDDDDDDVKEGETAHVESSGR